MKTKTKSIDTIKRLHVKVTAHDIKKGTKCNAFYCPIAIAAKRALTARGYGLCRVSAGTTYICADIFADNAKNTQFAVFMLPIKGQQFVRKFDAAFGMRIPEPMSFYAYEKYFKT